MAICSDLAIMSTKGMGSTSPRQLLETLAPETRIFVLHDFDKSGFSIAHRPARSRGDGTSDQSTRQSQGTHRAGVETVSYPARKRLNSSRRRHSRLTDRYSDPPLRPRAAGSTDGCASREILAALAIEYQ